MNGQYSMWILVTMISAEASSERLVQYVDTSNNGFC